MSKLTGKFERNYRSKKGNIVFVYSVEGTEKDMQAYEESVGENIRHDEVSGKPLYFTTRYAGDRISLLITSNGNVVVDTSEFDKAASLASQFGGNLGQSLADAAAAKLLGNLGSSVQVTAKAEQPAVEQPEGPEDLG
jgi:hypothetical protein